MVSVCIEGSVVGAVGNKGGRGPVGWEGGEWRIKQASKLWIDRWIALGTSFRDLAWTGWLVGTIARLGSWGTKARERG